MKTTSLTERTIFVLDYGSVALTDWMGDDQKPAKIARTSFANKDERTLEEDVKLASYLLNARHSTPFEFVQLEFYVVAPLFVTAQWHRHRTARINQISGRYKEMEDRFYVPDINRCHRQSKSNKQGSSIDLIDNPEQARKAIEVANQVAFNLYKELLKTGIAKELARIVLPVNTYTEFYWGNSLHNTLHFLSLRMDSHAQYEIRVYANAMHKLLTAQFPNLMKIWDGLQLK